jgi:hypothetical protein
MNITREEWDELPYHDRPDYDICDECGKEAEGKWADFGYGPGEFWGRPYNDVNWQWVSTCCEADILDPRGFRVDKEEE